MKKWIVAAVALIAVSASAVTAVSFFDRYTKLLIFTKGLMIGPTDGANKVQADQANGVYRHYGLQYPYDFPAIVSPVYSNSFGGCLDGPTLAKTGVRVGDLCAVTSDRTVWDGGKPMYFHPECEVPGNGYILLKGCVDANDGGVSVDPVDAGYNMFIDSLTP